MTADQNVSFPYNQNFLLRLWYLKCLCYKRFQPKKNPFKVKILNILFQKCGSRIFWRYWNASHLWRCLMSDITSVLNGNSPECTHLSYTFQFEQINIFWQKDIPLENSGLAPEVIFISQCREKPRACLSYHEHLPTQNTVKGACGQSVIISSPAPCSFPAGKQVDTNYCGAENPGALDTIVKKGEEIILEGVDRMQTAFSEGQQLWCSPQGEPEFLLQRFWLEL